MYINEVSPLNLRGTLGVSFQLGVVVTLFFSQAISLKEALGSESGWNYALGILFVFFSVNLRQTRSLVCRFAHHFQCRASDSPVLCTRKSEIFIAQKKQSNRSRKGSVHVYEITESLRQISFFVEYQAVFRGN